MLAFAALAGLQGPRALRNLLGQHQELGGRVRVAVLDAPAAKLITAVAALRSAACTVEGVQEEAFASKGCPC